MHNSTVLILALTMLWSISVTARGETSASTATLKDVQCRQNACTTKCDAKGEKCLVSCSDNQTNSNCKKSFYRASPYGVLEVSPQQKSRLKSIH